MRRKRQILAGIAAGVASVSALQAEVDFAHEVVPVLKANCVECHGGAKSKGGLSMNSRALILEAEVVEPGKPDESLLIELLTTSDEDERMPPVKKQKEPLKPDEIVILKKWIAEGLPWEEGFTFADERYEPPLKPRRPELPKGPAGMGPVDLIVRAYFNGEEVKAPTVVDDAAFMRRLYLDVIGLPPSPEELTDFVQSRERDKRSKLVTELLGRDQDYAAHWMTFWNDLLRNAYSGTGYIDGGRRQITEWLYRSLLENKPYDQFVRELISPTADSEGFIKGIKWRGNVNASQTPEVQFSQSISQVFLGINMKCASCHDSFIDRWTLQEAYGLAAIYSEKPLELFRCDKPTGKTAAPAWIFPELGQIDPAKPQKERLGQLAGLMTHPENGRMQRTIVNRIWKQMMGRGIVHPVDSMGTAPWSEDLLDYLATYLVEQNYDLKKVIALIASSKAYQLKAEVASESAADYLFRGPVMKRMSAEQFLDAIRSVTGEWPKPDDKALKGAGRAQGGQLSSVMKVHGWKDWGDRPVRAVFSSLDPLQSALGRPNRAQVVSARPDLVTTLEAINLANGPQLAAILKAGAAKLASESSPDDLVDRLYFTALSRPPSREERSIAIGLMGNPMTPEGVEDSLWTLFMLPEFQFVN